MKRALIIGRFQPLHNGHIGILEEIACEDYDEIIVGIGSAQYAYSIKNPFSAGERFEMIKNSMKGSEKLSGNLSKFYIIPIPDIHNNMLWVAHVRSLLPGFDVVYSANPLVKRLFMDAGVPVVVHKLHNRDNLCGEHIRNIIVNSGDWRSLVPEEAAKIIDKIGGVERLKDLSLIRDAEKNL